MMKKEDCKVGMKIRCYKKTAKYVNAWEEIQNEYGKNPIGTITKIYPDIDSYRQVEITFGNYDYTKDNFNFSDIGPTINNELSKKYKIISDLTLANFIQRNPCQNELLKLIEQFPMQTKYTLEQVTSHQIWIDWLIKNGFIQEIKPEKFYHIGQRFLDLCNDEFILAQVAPLGICLISLTSGNRQQDPILVKNNMFISQEEFNKIASPDSYLFVEKE